MNDVSTFAAARDEQTRTSGAARGADLKKDESGLVIS